MLLLSSWPPLPSTGASLVFSPWFRLLTFLLSMRSLPFRSMYISLAFVSFALVFFSSTSLLHSCTCPCFLVLACGLLGHYSWSSFGLCRQCFLVPLLRHSVESQCPSRRSPPFGPSCLIGVVLGCSGPNRLWSWFFLLFQFWSLVPFFFSFCSWLGGPPSLCAAPLRFLCSSISLGRSPFSCIVWFSYFCLSCGYFPSPGCPHCPFFILCISFSFTMH